MTRTKRNPLLTFVQKWKGQNYFFGSQENITTEPLYFLRKTWSTYSSREKQLRFFLDKKTFFFLNYPPSDIISQMIKSHL